MSLRHANSNWETGAQTKTRSNLVEEEPTKFARFFDDEGKEVFVKSVCVWKKEDEPQLLQSIDKKL